METRIIHNREVYIVENTDNEDAMKEISGGMYQDGTPRITLESVKS